MYAGELSPNVLDAESLEYLVEESLKTIGNGAWAVIIICWPRTERSRASARTPKEARNNAHTEWCYVLVRHVVLTTQTCV